MNPRIIIATILAAAVLAACTPARRQPTHVPVLTQPRVEAPPAEENPGSLFEPAEANYLFGDTRARTVGDVVIVNIVETSKATNKADTTSERESSLSMGVENFFGKNDLRAVPIGPSFGLVGKVGTTPMVKTSSTSTFEGTGETKRESTVTATLAARVVKVLPGGLLQVEGVRETKVNNETQILVVTGLARSKDISPENTISSTHLANARIEYFGEGVLADKQRPGWLTRILDHVWPF